MKVNRVKGTYDVLPVESTKWQQLEKFIREILKSYNYEEIRTPIFEHSEVFHRDSEMSDMVTKETYNFLDRGNRNITLRPEGTAGVIRAYVENKMYVNGFDKLYYIGPNFRYERPQKGRYRQFYQFGVEALGSLDPLLDAEVIILGYQIMEELKLENILVKVNTLGDRESKLIYEKKLREHFRPHKAELCRDCQERIEKNPLRILDCKIDQNHEAVINAPTPFDYLTDYAKTHFETVLKELDKANINYEVNKRLVRGLDYYSHTVFEIDAKIEGFGAQNTLLGGGRYENLVEELGGPKTSAVGFACGMERLLYALEIENSSFFKKNDIDAFLLILDENSKAIQTKLLYDLRKAKFNVDALYISRSFKSALKFALSKNPKYLLILGENELNNNTIQVKNTKTENQEEVLLVDLINYLKKENK